MDVKKNVVIQRQVMYMHVPTVVLDDTSALGVPSTQVPLHHSLLDYPHLRRWYSEKYIQVSNASDWLLMSQCQPFVEDYKERNM